MKRFFTLTIVALAMSVLLTNFSLNRVFASEKKEKAEKVIKMSMGILKVILDSRRNKKEDSWDEGYSNQDASNWGASDGNSSDWDSSGGNTSGWGPSTTTNGDAPFDFSPNPAQAGQEVTLRISPSLQSFLPQNTSAKVYYNGRSLPNKSISGGNVLVVTVPDDASTGYFELVWGDLRVQATKKLIVSDSLRTTSSTFNKHSLPVNFPMNPKINPWTAKKDISPTGQPEISIQIEKEYLPVSEKKRGKTKDIDVDIKLKHSSPITTMTFRVFGELPPVKKYDIKINGRKFYGKQYGSITIQNPPTSYSPKLKLRRRWGNGPNGRFTYTIEVRVRDANGIVGSKTAQIVMGRAS